MSRCACAPIVDREPAFRILRARKLFSRPMLLAGVSALALLAHAMPAEALCVGRCGGGGAASATGAATASAIAAAQQAAQAAQLSINALTRATLAVQAMQATQNTARNVVQALAPPSTVPNGLVAGGLVPDSGLARQGAANPVSTWVGANTPTQTTGGSQTTVTINQTAPQALLNWRTFNVGAQTTVNFNQQGNTNWVAINKIDGNGVPSQIFGSIRADGQVYLINRNGIIFGGTSQVNVGTLVASALPINDALVNAGTLFGNLDNQFTFSAYAQPGGSLGPTSPFAPDPATATTQDSKVSVAAGAIIATSPSPTNNGGRVILIGPEVENQGTILTPDGQTILAAGQQVALLPHASGDPSLRGLDVYIGAVRAPVIGVAAPLISQASNVVSGTASNGGLIEADRGNITIAGAAVNQLGALISTTSVSLNGRIDLSAYYGAQAPAIAGPKPFVWTSSGIVTIGANSIVKISPDFASADTVVGTQLAVPSEVNVAGSAVYLGQSAEIYAPNGNVAITTSGFDNFGNGHASGQIYLDSGALIDVSGSIDVSVPVVRNVIAAQLFGAQLANSPLERNGPLHGLTVNVDIRQTGTNPDGSTWIGTPVADVSGYVNLIQRTVGELTTGGGTITLSAGQSVVLQQGSVLNVSGGWINYQGGMIRTTVLVGADGRLYDIASASPNIPYVGVAGQFVVDHAHWGVKDVFINKLIGAGYYDPGYIQGASGGSISIQASQAALDGDMYGLTVAGPRQRQTLPSPASFTLNTGNGIVFAAANSARTAAPFVPGAYGLGSNAIVYLPADLTSAKGFGSVSVTGNGSDITIASDLVGQANGSLTMVGNNIDVEAHVTIPGGTIALCGLGQVCGGTITLGGGASLNTAGLVVDDMPGSPTAGLPIAIKGGSVSLGAFALDLEAGSTIDVSGGLALSATGKISDGDAGRIKLTNGVSTNSTTAITTYQVGGFVMDATLKGYGVGVGGKGGTLSIGSGPAVIQIGGASSDPGTVVLSPDFFSQGGFANYTISAITGVIVAANTTVAPTVASYQPVIETGGAALLTPTLLPAVLRSPVSLTLDGTGVTAPDGAPLVRGRVVIESGASIILSPTSRGAGSFTIGGQNKNVATIAGSIIAPGGAISVSTCAENQGETTLDIAPGTVLSTAGTLVPTIDSRGNVVGTVLPGGSIGLAGNIVAEAGAVLDVSGASGVVSQLPTSGFAQRLHVSPVVTEFASDGGSLTFSASDTLSIAATLHGAPGGPSAVGGSLTLNSAAFIDVWQNASSGGASRLPAAFQGSTAVFYADSFNNGLFAALTLNGFAAFSGPVTISAPRSISLGGGLAADSAVTLAAPYVALGGALAPPQQVKTPSTPGSVPTFGPGSLSVSATDLIDIGSFTLFNIGSTGLTSRNDIRGSGALVAAGNITMTAGQIYPATDSVFTVEAFGSNGTVNGGSITIAGTGVIRQLPFSAGGELNLFATTITQDGVLRAPLGVINLGADANTQSQFGYPAANAITLGAGSITSVSAVDPTTGQALILPYGLAPNGTTWAAPSGLDITNGGVPVKTINVSAAGVAIESGATLDLDGGGDLYAYNWVNGLGGTKDILAASTSFAIIPTYAADYAPVVKITNNATGGLEPGWSNANIALGDQITLAASTNGLAAGTYTLLPARYALLPGAYLITPMSGTSTGTGASVARPDGSSVVAGSRFSALDPAHALAPQPGLFQVAAPAQVHARAQYDGYLASGFLAGVAQGNSVAPPRLPIDAGVLNLTATTSMIIQGAVRMAAPPGGLGGVAAISSTSNIVINDTGAGPSPGTLYLSAAGLYFGAQPLVIGGTIGSGATGLTLVATTGSIEVGNDAQHPLEGPDLILISKNLLTLDANADVEQAGTLTNPAPLFTIGVTGVINAGSGNGSLLRVSSDPAAAITRINVTPGGTPSLSVGAGARIAGASVILDTTGSTNFDPRARLASSAATLASGRISFQFDPTMALQPNPGFVLSPAILGSLASTTGALSLLSYSSIDFYGSGVFGTTDSAGRPIAANLALHAGGIRGFFAPGESGTVTINAAAVSIDNTPGAAAPVAVTGANGDATPTGTLVFNTDTVTLGANAFNIVGYNDVVLDAPNGVLASNSGSLATVGALDVSTAVITGAAGASQTITAGGALTVNGAAGHPAPTVSGGLGASLTLVGASVAENGAIVLPSGNLTLHATAGDVIVAGTLDVSGTAQAFFDETRYTSGGTIALTSDTGSVTLAPGSLVSVAAQPGAGNAGALTGGAPFPQTPPWGARLRGRAVPAAPPAPSVSTSRASRRWARSMRCSMPKGSRRAASSACATATSSSMAAHGSGTSHCPPIPAPSPSPARSMRPASLAARSTSTPITA